MIRHYRKAEELSKGSKKLPNVIPDDHVYIQDQRATTSNKWHLSGVVLETLPHDSYLVTVDGSRHVTQHNRKFVPFNADQPVSTSCQSDVSSKARHSDKNNQFRHQGFSHVSASSSG